MPKRTAAELALSRLKDNGIDVLLANGGTDFPSIIEAYANLSESGLDFPEAMVVPHEGVAVGMAHGYYLMSGKTAGVMVHVNVGLANSVMGLVNAASERIPLVMLSGRTPLTEIGRFGSRNSPIHWGQEMRDQAGMVRETVKWDYELRYPEQAGLAVDRAVGIARSAPTGPVYLSLPREVLAETVDVADTPAPAPAIYGPADAALVAHAAELLAGAERPVIIGQSPDHLGGFATLSALAERHAIPLVDYWSTRQSLAPSHPMHVGMDPSPWVKDADVLLLLDAAVPWIPSLATPPEGCTVIGLGPDPLHRATPMRSFPLHLTLAGDGQATLAALRDAMEAMAPGPEVEARRAAAAAWRDEKARALAEAAEKGNGTPMSPAWVSKCLSDAADETTTFFNELGVDPAQMKLTEPLSFFSTPLSGGLGWALPAALGAKLADRSRRVIACVGDGSYMFANPVACHQVAAAQNLPILTVVFNNGIWNAVRRSTLHMYPKGKAAAANVMPITSLGPSPDHAAIARASGAHAERVESGADLPAAIERAFAAMDKGQQALLDVVVSY